MDVISMAALGPLVWHEDSSQNMMRPYILL